MDVGTFCGTVFLPFPPVYGSCRAGVEAAMTLRFHT